MAAGLVLTAHSFSGNRPFVVSSRGEQTPSERARAGAKAASWIKCQAGGDGRGGRQPSSVGPAACRPGRALDQRRGLG